MWAKYSFFLIFLLLAGCESSFDSCPLPSNPNPVFTYFPADWNNVRGVTGFGTHGSNHPEGVTKLYLYHDGAVDLISPADGIIKKIHQDAENDYRLLLCVSGEVKVEFAHVGSVSVPEGKTVTAGEAIGKTQNNNNAVDFNVYSKTTDNGFPSTWPLTFKQATCPADYFSPALKTEFINRWNTIYLQKLITEFYPEACEPVYCRALNMNEAGKLWGVWFVSSGTPDEFHGKLLSFTNCDDGWVNGTRDRLRTIATINGEIYYSFNTTDDSDQDNGEHCLFLTDNNHYMRYQFLAPDQLKVEIQENTCPTHFTSKAHVYGRNYVEYH